MPKSHITLLSAYAIAFIAFVVSAAGDPNWSASDVLFLSVFGVLFVTIAYLALAIRGKQSVEGQYGMPRSVWIVFASFAAAFALQMLIAIVAMPLIGFKSFDYLFGSQSWWITALLAAALYPFVRRRLL